MSAADENKISIYNQLSFTRKDTVVLDGAHTFEEVVTQTYTDFHGNLQTAFSASIPAMSAMTLTKVSALTKASNLTAGKEIEQQSAFALMEMC